jgi:hypothetical protein
MSLIQPCQRSTIAVAAEGRPDWDSQETENAIIRAYQTGTTPARILFEVVRLMAMPEGESEPRDLDAALTRPSGWRSPAPSAPRRRAKAHRG